MGGPGPTTPAGARRLWLIVSLIAPPRGQELLLVDALRSTGARLVERDGERLHAHFLAPDGSAAGATPTAETHSPAAAPPAVRRLLREVEAAARSSTTATHPEIYWRWESHDDWLARGPSREGARRVTERITVAPAPSEPPAPAESPPHPEQPPAAELVIRLAPGVGFGTAEHPTTRACLRRLEALVEPGDRILDVGAGTGILSICAALLGARTVLALEMDPEACADARRNVALNQVEDRVEVRETRVGPRELRGLRGRRRHQGIVANLQAGTIRHVLPGMRAALAPGGWLVVSGIAREERDGVVRDALATDLTLTAEVVDDGWWTGTLRRQPTASRIRRI